MSERKRALGLGRFTVGGAAVAVFCALGASDALAARVTSINFNGQGDSSVIEIKGDGPLDADKQENTQDKQIVIELKGATLAKSASRSLDTSSFNSKVSLVSPYKVPGGSRVVIQLRDNASAEMSQNGNSIQLKIANPAGGESGSASTSTADASTGGAPAADSSASTSAAPQAAPPAGGSADAATATENAKAEPPAEPARPKDRMDEFLESRETHQFHGRPITLQARDADLVDVFRLIAEASGFNIILGEDVKGKAPSLSLTDVPWDQALDVILRTKRLGAERSGSILRITTLSSFTLEKQDELKARIAAEANAPRITRIFPISFATLSELQAVLTKFATVNQASIGSSSATGAAAAPVQSGIVTTDNRTNSIIINDTPDNIERARKIIAELDTQTPQVLIEAKVVEADEQGSNSINGSLGGGNYTDGGTPPTNVSWAGSTQPNSLSLDPLVGTPGPNTSSSTFNGQSGSILGLGFGFIPGVNQLNATLNLLESQQHIQVISSPRSVVLNKEHANIVETTPVGIPQTTVTAGSTVTTIQVTQAQLSLDVTPTVTNEGSVMLKLTVHRDVPQAITGGEAVSSRSMDTTVLVESGSTLVLGGVYSATTQHNDSGFPILHNIPIIGWFFGQQSDEADHEELIFFITPRILNAKEAGLT